MVESYSFSSKPLYLTARDRYDVASIEKTKQLRDVMFERFKRHISLLLEQKKSRKVAGRKGFLNPRALHKYRFSDNVFQKRITYPSSDTTILFLIDGSGSMASNVNTPVGHIPAIQMCGAVASAFAKANHLVLKNKIPIEVFLKSAPVSSSPDLTGTDNGHLVTLTRLYSSKSGYRDSDKLCSLTCHSPITDSEGRSVGSYTSEYAVLPALNKWIKKNVKTKKCIVFNLTDGETFCTLGSDGYQFRNNDTKAMRLKYLRGIPNMTLMISDGHNKSELSEVYGENVMAASEDFSGALFKTFAGFLD